MLDRWLTICATIVVTKRVHIFIATGLLVVLSSFGITRLQSDPAPESLLASANGDLADEEKAFEARFGSSDDVLVAILSAPKDGSIYTREALGYLYLLTEAAAKFEGVDHVESLTRLPVRQKDVAAETLTLDDLDAPSRAEPEPDPVLLSALADVVASAPDRFPNGLASVSERMAGSKFAPVISSPEPSPAEIENARKAVSESTLVRGRLVGKGGRDALVAVLPNAQGSAQAGRIAAALRTWTALHAPPSGFSVDVGGLPVLRSTIVDHMRRDQRVLIPGTLVVSLLLMLISLRWWAGVIFPLLQVGLTSLCVLGGMALAGIKLTVITNILPALLIILGLSDSIHLVHRYMEELGHSNDTDASIRATILAVGRACFGTASTTAAGLFALALCKTKMLAEFGVVGGLGVMLAYASTLLVLPACLHGLRPPQREVESTSHGDGRIARALVPWTVWIVRNPRVTLFASLAVAFAAFAWGRDVQVDSALLDQFRPGDPIYQTTSLLEREFDGVRPLDVSLSAKTPGRFHEPAVLKAIHDVAFWAGKQRGVLSTLDPVDPLEQTWNALAETTVPHDALRTKEGVLGLTKVLEQRTPNPLASLVDPGGEKARLRIKLADIGSRATLEFAHELELRLHEALAPFPDVHTTLLGDAYTSSRGLDAVVGDLTGSLTTALLTVFVLILISFRSLRYSALTVPPGVLPLAFTLAWMSMRHIPLNAATAIIFSVSIGITVDGSIHLLARLREELKRTDLLRVAMVRTLRGSGEALIIACGALLLGFAVLLLSSFVPVQRFAELIAISIATCVFSTLVVLPALIFVLGRRFFARAR